MIQRRQLFDVPDALVCREVFLRCHQNQMRRGDGPGHHTLRQLDAATDGRIKPVRDEIDLAIVDVPFRGHGGVLLEKIGHQRQQKIPGETGCCAQTQKP